MNVAPTSSKTMIWTGRVLSALPTLVFFFSAVMKFAKPPGFAEGFAHLGLSEHLAPGLGTLELACALIYLVPRTAMLGAILLTGYLGGAILTHLRVGDPYWMQALLGVMVWGGLFLRDARLRALLPLRSE
jgi:DoxX-like family